MERDERGMRGGKELDHENNVKIYPFVCFRPEILVEIIFQGYSQNSLKPTSKVKGLFYFSPYLIGRRRVSSKQFQRSPRSPLYPSLHLLYLHRFTTNQDRELRECIELLTLRRLIDLTFKAKRVKADQCFFTCCQHRTS